MNCDAPPPPLSKRLKISLDELRMQVLGVQVLFGFQFQTLFQDGFERAGPAERGADSLSLAFVLVALAMLLAAPAQHRLVEPDAATRRLITLSAQYARLALAVQALAFGSIGLALALHMNLPMPWLAGLLASSIAFSGWFGLGAFVRAVPCPHLAEREMIDLHTRIDQMLTEARVILPGVQAMLGFQLIVFMTPAFEKLPRALQLLHAGGLALALITITLLIAPAAVHRLAFHGNDDPRFHRLGTRLLNVALLPLALGIAVESFVAAWKLTEHDLPATLAAAGVLSMLIATWYVFPLLHRARSQ